jgi:hypothetical protein
MTRKMTPHASPDTALQSFTELIIMSTTDAQKMGGEARTNEEHGPIIDEATLFASPLPITGERKTTTRVELWVRVRFASHIPRSDNSRGMCITLETRVSARSISPFLLGRTYCIKLDGTRHFRGDQQPVVPEVSQTVNFADTIS